MLEQHLINNCAPTLAGIKCAGLFSYHYSSLTTVLRELAQLSGRLKAKGVYIDVLAWRKQAVLLYLYRPTLLEKELKKEGVGELLQQYGYSGRKTDNYLSHLKRRIQESDCFPHEIGIFLGYPIEDVIGFIQNEGKNCKCCGFWKVYCNEQETGRYFEKLKKCNRVYSQVFAAGRSLLEMTVVA
ncbi:MAG: DUF3793 family protein [Lachnospiraceae bacterium]|nr:DUF3793 family protein [Lachnospiraceae bacterium]